MSSRSLRRRLVTLLLPSVALAWIIVSVLTYQDARQAIDSVLDAHLAQAATLLSSQADHELDEAGSEGLEDLRPYGEPVAFQIWDASGALLFASANAPPTRLSPRRSGFDDSTLGAQHWRVFSRARDGVVVQIAESREGRSRLARRFVMHALWPLVIGLPLLGILAWIAVGRALRPLVALREEVRLRRGTDLSPLPINDVPEEVAPLVLHLNALFERIRGTLESERRFTAHAAHELRTPLAGIRAQAESAANAASGDERRDSLGRVIVACDRLARLITQLLTLARMDESPADAAASCRLDEIAARVVADLAPAALAHGIDLGLRREGAVTLAADPVLMEVLLRNLVDNALRYSNGRRVDVIVEASTQGAKVAVVDDGVGIAAAELPQLGRAFYRGSQPTGDGTGLGLSIVSRIVERYRGELRFAPGADARGLAVTARFPA